MEPVPTSEKVIAIKQSRVKIDETIQHVESLVEFVGRAAGGREVALTITKLQEAKMWLGKALGELDNTLPEEYRDEYVAPNPPQAE